MDDVELSEVLRQPGMLAVGGKSLGFFGRRRAASRRRAVRGLY